MGRRPDRHLPSPKSAAYSRQPKLCCRLPKVAGCRPALGRRARRCKWGFCQRAAPNYFGEKICCPEPHLRAHIPIPSRCLHRRCRLYQLLQRMALLPRPIPSCRYYLLPHPLWPEVLRFYPELLKIPSHQRYQYQRC